MKRTKGRAKGIRASRDKLAQAMRVSGFRSQANLAAAIAELEGLEAPPKDMVNRVFTEKPVHPASIDRVASVLGVQPEDLYLFDEEPEERPFGDTDTNTDNTGAVPQVDREPSRSYLKPSLVGLGALFLSVALGLFFFAPFKHEAEWLKPAKLIVVEGGAGSYTQWPLPGLADALVAELDAIDEISASKLILENAEFPVVDAIRGDSGVDLVIEPMQLTSNRHQGLVVNLTGRNVTVPIYHNGWHLLGTVPSEKAIVSAVVEQVKKLNREPDLAASYLSRYEATEVINAYMIGEAQLDGELIDNILGVAQTQFSRALRIDPSFAPAAAGLCQTLIAFNVARADSSYLNDAQVECDRAAKLAPPRAELITSQGHIYRYQGKLEKAEEQFRLAIQQSPDFTEAHLGLAMNYLARAREAGGVEFFAKAHEVLADASAIEPDYWKVPFTQARVAYFSGETDRALEFGTVAVDLDANMASLSNQATFQFCYGELEQAKNLYERTLSLNFTDPLVYTQLAVAYFFLGEHDEAIKSSLKYFESVKSRSGQPEMQAVLSHADILAGSGDDQLASDYYQKALQSLQQHSIAGDTSASTEAQIIHANVALAALNGELLSSRSSYLEQVLELMDKTQSPQAQIYLLLALANLGALDFGDEVLAKLDASCQGYVKHPLLLGSEAYAFGSIR